MRLFRGLGRKMLTSPGKVQMTTLVSVGYQTLESDGRNETFSRSQPEDADISKKGADDHIGLCLSIRLGVFE